MKRKSSPAKEIKTKKERVGKAPDITKEDVEESETIDGLSSLIKSLGPSRAVLKRFCNTKDDQSSENLGNSLDVNADINKNKIEFDATNETVESDDDGYLIDDTDSEDSEDDECKKSIIRDPYKIHYEQDIDEDIILKLCESKFKQVKKMVTDKEVKEIFDFSEDVIGNLEPFRHSPSPNQDLSQMIKEGILEKWKQCNIGKKRKSFFTGVQKNLYGEISSYKDLFYHNENHINGDEIRRLFCMHVANHVLKAHARILKNNAKIASIDINSSSNDSDFRDQGLTRPKVLILAPFRDSCLRIVNDIINFGLIRTKGQVMNKKRFTQEFSSEPDDSDGSIRRSDDFKHTFRGNIDDCFRIGMTLSKNTVKLYSPFYSADIIIASPLGLRTIIGAEGETQDYDFLSSIEILILDQADVFLMQNWEHLLHIMDYLNKTPKDSHGTDFSRVRMWSINQWSRYYRQTLLFSSIQTPELNSLFNKYCSNYNGKIRKRPVSLNGTAHHIVKQIPQVYYKIDSNSFTEVAEQRFNFFINKLLPKYRNELSTSTAIFIPSYFDFVRIRNYFKKEEMSFVQISEYSQRSNISRARLQFYEKKKQFILLTERFHFFYRYKIRGIKHVIFYELPHYPHFFSDIVNYMDFTSNTASVSSNITCSVVFSKFDGCKLERIVGNEKCQQMLVSKKREFMVMTNG